MPHWTLNRQKKRLSKSKEKWLPITRQTQKCENRKDILSKQVKTSTNGEERKSETKHATPKLEDSTQERQRELPQWWCEYDMNKDKSQRYAINLENTLCLRGTEFKEKLQLGEHPDVLQNAIRKASLLEDLRVIQWQIHRKLITPDWNNTMENSRGQREINDWLSDIEKLLKGAERKQGWQIETNNNNNKGKT